MKIGIFGGSFDPPHLGHLVLADEALQHLSLDKVLFIPAFHSPFKSEEQSGRVELRCEMLELAINDHPKFEMDLHEVLRGGTSYTVDTLRHLKEQHPDDELFLLLGGDTFSEFSSWREPDEIVKHVRLAVVNRPDFPVDLSSHPYGEHAVTFPMPLLDISSSGIRNRVAEGKTIRYLVPWQVRTFIEFHGWFRSSG